jgi:aryl-alcohol dehydrogenase-like predicted oxidoreductase
MMGKFLKQTPEAGSRLVIATKFLPMPYRWTKAAFRRALRGSLRRLQRPQVDLYQIHFPFPPISVEVWAEALADACADGLVSAVGVSNYNESQMRRAFGVLAKRGVVLASNQVPYHLLDRRVELNGLLQVCRELGVTLIAYSPLGQGALTGKYGPERPLPGVRGRRYNRSLLERTQPLIHRLREIGENQGGKTVAQVALNWLMCKGAVPIPGAKNARQAQENAGALGWRLEPSEVDELDALSLELAPPEGA